GSSEASADQAGVAEQLRAEEVRSLISQREKARDEKRYQDADRVREKLDDYGIIVEDGPSGTSWRRK
ncbi:MAG: cysteine--tRNA ligase, partial [Gammaproteobacteria bacterium]|nr:cysteine--tRNA ligase [Gammaproteobacteria bacterium]